MVDSLQKVLLQRCDKEGKTVQKFRLCLGVRTCEVFLCLAAIVRVRVYYVYFFVFFVLRHW